MDDSVCLYVLVGSEIMSQSKIRLLLPHSSTRTRSRCARTNAQILPIGSLQNLRIAQPERYTRLDRATDLPPPMTRWTRRRKAAVVMAVWSGGIALAEARRVYALSLKEFRTWEAEVESCGPGGASKRSGHHSFSRGASVKAELSKAARPGDQRVSDIALDRRGWGNRPSAPTDAKTRTTAGPRYPGKPAR
jgi:hypothetical protein